MQLETKLNYKRLVPFILIAISIAIAGCVSSPLKADRTTQDYELFGNGDVGISIIGEGTLEAAAAQWPSDCTATLKAPLLAAISIAESASQLGGGGLGGGYGSSGVDPETMKQTVSIMKDITNSISCSLKKDGYRGTLTIGMKLTYKQVQDINALSQKSGSMGGLGGGQTSLTITKQDGTIYAKIPVSSSSLGSLGGTGYGSQVQNIIRLRVHGDVQSITPTNYVQSGDSYVWDASQVSGGAIEVVYKPAAGFSGGLVMWLIIIVVVVVVVILLLYFLVMRKGTTPGTVVPQPPSAPAAAAAPAPKIAAPPKIKANPKAVKYIKTQTKAGYGLDDIKSSLRDSGYTDAEIDASIKKAIGG